LYKITIKIHTVLSLIHFENLWKTIHPGALSPAFKKTKVYGFIIRNYTYNEGTIITVEEHNLFYDKSSMPLKF